jgi:hypothetical protein
VRDLWYQKISEAANVANIRYAFVNYIPYFMPSLIKEKWESQVKDVLDFLFEFSVEWLKDGYASYLEYLSAMIEDAKKRA